MTHRLARLCIGLLLASFLSGPALAQSTGTISGDAVAIGPDIIRIDTTEVVLLGIDAPEANQVCNDPNGTWKCGDTAFATMDQVAKAAQVTCTLKGPHDAFGRFNGTCLQGDLDIAREMVKQGMALAYPHDPESKNYLDDEKAARAAKVGLWAPGVKFDDPWVYRVKNNHSPLK